MIASSATIKAAAENWPCRLLRTTLTCCLLVLAFGYPLQAQEPGPATVTATTSHDQVRIAESFDLVIEVEVPRGSQVAFANLSEQLGDFAVLAVETVQDIPADTPDRRLWLYRVSLESYQAGALLVPAVEIQTVVDGTPIQLYSPEVEVSVASSLTPADSVDNIRPIQPVLDATLPRESSYAWLGWLLFGSAVVMAASAVGVAVTLIVRRRRWITPHDWARRELTALQTETADPDADTLLGCQRLAEILRAFLEQQFELPATSQTTEELQRSLLADGQIDHQTVSRLGQLMQLSDEVKFAGKPLPVGELGRAIGSAVDIVDEVWERIESDVQPTEAEATS